MLDINFDVIKRRATERLQKRLVPQLIHKINKKLRETKRLLLTKYGYENEVKIDQFLAICQDRFNKKFGEQALMNLIEQEVTASTKQLSGQINEDDVVKLTSSKDISLELDFIPSIEEFFKEKA